MDGSLMRAEVILILLKSGKQRYKAAHTSVADFDGVQKKNQHMFTINDD